MFVFQPKYIVRCQKDYMDYIRGTYSVNSTIQLEMLLSDWKTVFCGYFMLSAWEQCVVSTDRTHESIRYEYWRRQLRLAGHIARMDFDRLPRKMHSSWVTEKRPIGAPEFTYGRGWSKALQKADTEKNNWYAKAQDRNVWRDTMNGTKVCFYL